MGDELTVVASGSSLDAVARAALQKILLESITYKREYGGMICLDGSVYRAMKARTSYEACRVDVGVHDENHGCPPGTQPVAYYHTHTAESIGVFKGSTTSSRPRTKPWPRTTASAPPTSGPWTAPS